MDQQSPKLFGYLILVGLCFVLSFNVFFIVEQRQQALIFQFGEIVRVIKQPGLQMKIPLVQEVHLFDNRVLNVVAEEKEVIAQDSKKLIVSAFAKYRIDDPLKFYQTVLDESMVRDKLNPILESSLRQVLGEVPLAALLSGERAEVMKKIQVLANAQAAGFGINIVDLRILRTDLPKENSEAVYRRMQTDREKEAKKFRAEGAEEALKIKSKADKDRKIIIAEAEKQSQILRGEGDGISIKIFADAFGRDIEFYSFYRSMQAYKKILSKDDTTFILSPESEFLKFIDNK
jgi:membrane protease subunit HflC